MAQLKNSGMQALAAMPACASHADRCSHVPYKGEQMVRYYGCYRNVCRGKRKAEVEDETLPTVLHPDEESSAQSRKQWARMFKKIYEVDPGTVPSATGHAHPGVHRGSGSDMKDPKSSGAVEKEAKCSTYSTVHGFHIDTQLRPQLLCPSKSNVLSSFSRWVTSPHVAHEPRCALIFALEGPDGVIRSVRLAVGAVGPKPPRTFSAEALVKGARQSKDIFEAAGGALSQGPWWNRHSPLPMKEIPLPSSIPSTVLGSKQC